MERTPPGCFCRSVPALIRAYLTSHMIVTLWSHARLPLRFTLLPRMKWGTIIGSVHLSVGQNPKNKHFTDFYNMLTHAKHMHMHICIHTHTYMRTCTHAHMHTHTNTHRYNSQDSHLACQMCTQANSGLW